MTNNYNENEKTNIKKTFAAVYDYFEVLIIATIFVLLCINFIFRPCTVDGSSMEKTLSNGQMLISTNFSYSPERGDIIIFHLTGSADDSYNRSLVKRVIGLPGDQISIDQVTNTVFINGEALGEEYVYDDPYYSHIYSQTTPLVVPEGYVFVLGDNRNNSSDSRKSSIGLVDQRRILGKIIIRISPFTIFSETDK